MNALKQFAFNPVVSIMSLLVLLVVILRLPSLTEPYWYGDEGIYLTIGQAMNHGAVLYADIVDHKTPLIYYFARVGTQLNFRLLMMVWMVLSSLSLFGIFNRLTKRLWLSASFTAGFVVVTSLPYLEGNIANGELFVMGFILLALWLFLRTRAGYSLLTSSPKKLNTLIITRQEVGWWLIAGMSLGAAILTKVPALFDVAAVFYLVWLAAWDQQFTSGWRLNKKMWLRTVKIWLVLGAGVLAPIVVSVLCFWLKGAGDAYLNFGLLYNFHYVQTWTLAHLPSWGQTLFSFPVKVVLLTAVLIKMTLINGWLSRQLRFATGWFYLALFASILSNRPYPHYMLQAIPPLVLVLGLAWHELTGQKKLTQNFRRFSIVFTAGSSLLVLWLIWKGLAMTPYPITSYYQRFFRTATGQITTTEYRNSFDSLIADNAEAAGLLRTSSDPKLFIWGTDPMLYALSGKQPVGRFTVAFHIEDLGLQEETIQLLQANPPEYIVVMKNQQSQLPGLSSLLQRHYRRSRTFDHFVVWHIKG